MKLDKAVKINELTTALEYADKTNMDLRAENERLRAELEGQPVIKSEWEEKCEEVERLRADLVRVANAAGVETPLQLTAIAETDEETTADLLVKHIERLRAATRYRNTHDVRASRIDAALAEADAALEMFEERSGLEEVVKALKGEA